jgi:hypothetical protein
VALSIAVLLTVIVPLCGQSGDQGSIAGVMFDSSGAVVADASVRVRNLSTSLSISTTTNGAGLFRFVLLPVGLYELTADHASFTTVQVKNIDLTVDANVKLTLHFNVAGAKEGITVMDEAPILETSRNQVSTTINNRLISNLPVNGRDFTIISICGSNNQRDAGRIINRIHSICVHAGAAQTIP